MEDIEKLIAALSACSRAKGHRCSECPLLSRYDYRVCAKTVMQKAATALASFLAENERLREELAESQRRERAAVERLAKIDALCVAFRDAGSTGLADMFARDVMEISGPGAGEGAGE